MGGLRVEGNTSGHIAEVDLENNLNVTLPTVTKIDGTDHSSYVGAVRSFYENDAGTITGTPYLKSPRVSDAHRLRIGTDTLLFTETFNGTAQGTHNWHHVFTTVACTQASGFLQFPTLTAITTGSYMRTWQHFPLFGSAPLYVEGTILGTLPMAANEKFFFGLSNVHIAGSATAKGTDGCWFEWNNAGIECVMAYNNTEVSSGVVVVPADFATGTTMHRLQMVVSEEAVEFFVDGSMVADFEVPAGQGQPFMQGSLPLYLHHFATAAVTGGTTIKISDVTVMQGDINTNKPWGHQMAAMGLNAYQLNAGTAVSGPLTMFTNLAADADPAAATPGNTSLTANLINLLGGRGVATLNAQTAAQDMIMQQWQNPVSAVAVTGRTLIITGIRISCYVQTILGTPAAGINCFEWGLCVGNTTATMATVTDSSTFASATAKGRRTLFLGYQSMGAAAPIGTTPINGDIDVSFDSAPLVVNPGEYVTTIMRQVNSAAAATGALGYTILFKGYFQ